jgi:hypothetical protein
MFRRDVLEAAGGFDVQLRQAEDVDLMLRVMLGGCRSSWLKKTTVMYRQHPGNLTRQTRQRVESVNRVFATFFSRPDLPPGIAAIEKQIVYYVLMWGAWHCIAGDNCEIPATCSKPALPGRFKEPDPAHPAGADPQLGRKKGA